MSGKTKKPMLSEAQVEQGLREVAALAKASKTEILLVGGVAMHLYGSDRLTGDLDFAASQQVKGLPPAGVLSFGGYQSKSPSGIPVDLIIRDDDYKGLYESALKSPASFEDCPVKVVDPEHLVAMKMVARRPKDEVDLATLLGLGVVNHARATRLVKKLLGTYAADDLRSHIEYAEFLKSRQKD